MREFLAAQSLKILPQAPFGDAVNQFVTKDDKHAMETFVSESLAGQVRQMLDLDSDEEDLESAMEAYRARAEEQFGTGVVVRKGRRVLRERPEGWDSDFDGRWEDQEGAWEEVEAGGLVGRGGEMEVDEPVKAPAKRGGRAKATTTRAAATKKAPAKKAALRTRRVEPSDDELDDDEEPAPAPARRAATRTRKKQVDDDEFEEEPAPAPARRGATRGERAAGAAGRRQPARSTRQTQTRLDFSQAGRSQAQALEISDDEVSDDFEM